MNIGIVIPGFSSSEHDWCIPVYLNLVRQLAKTESVRVIAMRYPARRDPYRVYGAQVIPLNGGSFTAGVGRWRLIARTAATLIRLHRQTPFDRLHAIWADETGFAACIAGRILRVPVVVSIAGGELARLPGYGLQAGRITRWLVGESLALADRITVPCTYAEGLVGRKVGNLDRVRTLPLGVDVEMFTPATKPRPPGPPRLLAVGSLIPVKGHGILLEAIQRLTSRLPDLQLDIVGEGPLLTSLRQQARSLDIANRVVFRGVVAHGALPDYYRAADLHVLTSQHEAFGMVVTEAAACGLATVGFNVGVLPEFAPEAGIAVPAGDVEQLADALATTISSDRLTAMGTAARRVVEDRFSLARMVKTYLEIMNDPGLRSPCGTTRQADL